MPLENCCILDSCILFCCIPGELKVFRSILKLFLFLMHFQVQIKQNASKVIY